MPEKLYTPRVAILASGGGSTAEAFIRATQEGGVNAEVGLVVCNNSPEKASVYERVARLASHYGLDIQTVMINSRTHPGGASERGQTDEESAAIADLVAAGGYAHVALMGYMKQVRGELVEKYGWRPEHGSIYEARMSNTHPGPLPETADTYGIYAQERVLEMGLTASKHTVHLVSAGIDEGPIIAEHPVEILPEDSPQTLFDRVQLVEKAELPGALNRFLSEQAEYLRNRS